MEQSTWQAVSAMRFAERSDFGLNALLGLLALNVHSRLCVGSAAPIVHRSVLGLLGINHVVAARAGLICLSKATALVVPAFQEILLRTISGVDLYWRDRTAREECAAEDECCCFVHGTP